MRSFRPRAKVASMMLWELGKGGDLTELLVPLGSLRMPKTLKIDIKSVAKIWDTSVVAILFFHFCIFLL